MISASILSMARPQTKSANNIVKKLSVVIVTIFFPGYYVYLASNGACVDWQKLALCFFLF